MLINLRIYRFGNNVKAYRKAQNKTQEALAAALECDQKYISRIENGQAKLLSCDSGFFAGGRVRSAMLAKGPRTALQP